MTPAEYGRGFGPDIDPDDVQKVRRDVPADAPEPRKKRKKSTPTTARTLAHCRKLGWLAGVVERRIPFPKPQGTKIDLFGVIDVVAVVVPTAAHHSWEDHGGDGPCSACWKPGAIGIQSTANIGGHHAKHRTKILAEPRALAWVQAGNRLELWTWAKQGGRGQRKLWTLRVEVFTVESWSAEALAAIGTQRGTTS